jgi:oxygen-independent coproporphyrinogen-3 oxidase
MKDITLYVNVPFCNSKCHFCSYVAHIKTSDLIRQEHRYADYVAALKQQIAYFGESLTRQGYAVNAIYFGGGTPTVLSTTQLVELREALDTHFVRSEAFQDATLETTPENVALHDFARLHAAGFDRVSMGVQSMVDERLRRIGRCHTRDQVIEAVALLRQAGYGNINVDLMMGLPGETTDELLETITHALALGVNHYTAYVYVPVHNTVMKEFMLLETYDAAVLEEKYSIVHGRMLAAGYGEYMCQYFSNDRTRCICDWVYFGLMNDWIGFGSDATSLFQQRMWLGPSDADRFIRSPLKAGEIFPAQASKEIVERHFYWALLSESGLDADRFARSLGLSLAEALHRYPRLHAWHHYLLDRGLLQEGATGLSFRTSEGKTHYVCKQIELNYHPDREVDFFHTHAAIAA